MPSNLDLYKKDLGVLVDKGEDLFLAMDAQCFPERTRARYGDKTDKYIAALPDFQSEYQLWYSEAKVLIKQLLPDRLSDFVGHYEKPKSRKDITNESYRIADYLQGLSLTREGRFGETVKVVVPEAAVPHFYQQIAILKSVQARFESSLFDIQQLVQADLFDSELDAAQELAKNKFLRAAGAVAGVVLERHLGQVCKNHNITISKKSPTIADLNDALKGGNVVDVPTWRSIQYLGDLRNLCDHDKQKEPTPERLNDLISGVMKITKTLF